MVSYLSLLRKVKGPKSNFMMCAINRPNRRMIKNLKDGENNNEKLIQPHRK